MNKPNLKKKKLEIFGEGSRMAQDGHVIRRAVLFVHPETASCYGLDNDPFDG